MRRPGRSESSRRLRGASPNKWTRTQIWTPLTSGWPKTIKRTKRFLALGDLKTYLARMTASGWSTTSASVQMIQILNRGVAVISTAAANTQWTTGPITPIAMAQMDRICSRVRARFCQCWIRGILETRLFINYLRSTTTTCGGSNELEFYCIQLAFIYILSAIIHFLELRCEFYKCLEESMSFFFKILFQVDIIIIYRDIPNLYIQYLFQVNKGIRYIIIRRVEKTLCVHRK